MILDEGESFYEHQLRGLQGIWKEQGKAQKQWHISGAAAYLGGPDGQPNKTRRFALSEGAHGGIVWGTGQFVLDDDFELGCQSAEWHIRTADGRKAFAWTYVGPGQDTAQGIEELRRAARDAREQQDTNLGVSPKRKGLVNQKLASQSARERRVDPADGGAYTWEELRGLYAGYTIDELTECW